MAPHFVIGKIAGKSGIGDRQLMVGMLGQFGVLKQNITITLPEEIFQILQIHFLHL
jgi:hypothetical protein